MSLLIQKCRVLQRLARFAVLTGWSLRQIAPYHWSNNTEQARITLKNRQSLLRRFVSVLGINIHLSGKLPEGQCIFVGNHRSYLDPLFVIIYRDCIPVAKIEMKEWPLIGKYADKTGIIFVERENSTNRFQVLVQIKKTLTLGHSLLIYPEGTSHSNSYTLPFNKSIFFVAAKYNVPVVPVTIEYGNKNMSFVNEDTFVSHFLNNFGRKENNAFVHFDEPILFDNPDKLKDEVKTAIDLRIQTLRKLVTDKK